MLKRILLNTVIFVMFFQTFKANTTYTAADLPTVDGKIYHLSLKPGDLAPNIIIVGDPGRAPLLAEYCLEKPYTADVYHRGLRTITGKIKNSHLQLSIVTTGMGTPSAEIVLNEIVALNEITLNNRTQKETPCYKTMNIIRLGTSGGLQSETALGTPVISAYAVGLDNTGLFYDVPTQDPQVLEIEKACKKAIDKVIPNESRFAHTIHPYAAAASSEIVQALQEAAQEEKVETKIGITASNSGFFANQGRDISRVALTIPDLDGVLSNLTFKSEKFGTLKIENMEMEASFIFHFFSGLNTKIYPASYRVGAVCPAIANRRLNTFDGHYEENVLNALRIILKAFEKLNATQQ